jgi:hypothetical protein
MSVSERDKGNDPNRVITRALLDARRRGLDDPSQIRYAVAAVLTVRPDMSAIDATRSVERLALRNGPKHA